MKLFVVTCAIVIVVQTIKPPSNFKTCNRKQRNFRGCLLEAARFGVTQLNRPYDEFKMPSLDPIHVIKIETSIESPSMNYTSYLTNLKFFKFTEIDIEKFDIDFEEKTLQLAASWPDLTAEADLTILGQILGLQIDGEGLIRTVFKNFRWTFDLTYKEVKKRNKTYVKPITSRFDGKPESVILEVVNLRRGDKEVWARGFKVVNDNWSDLYEDVRESYLGKTKTTMLQMMNGWFSRVSLEESFDN